MRAWLIKEIGGDVNAMSVRIKKVSVGYGPSGLAWCTTKNRDLVLTNQCL
jgi:hypothetical protein